jgi:hypothetical protein
MQIISKLQTVGMLIALLSAIGGGFYTWGTFNQRLDVIEKKKVQSIDLTEIHDRIAESEDGLSDKIEALQSDLQAMKALIKINEAAINYMEAKLTEFKAEQGNPLLR